MTTAHAPEAPAAKPNLDESIKTLRSELATSPQDDQAYYDERFNALVEEHGLSADLCLAFASVIFARLVAWLQSYSRILPPCPQQNQPLRVPAAVCAPWAGQL